MNKKHIKTYADAHNHLNGILPVEALKIMMSKAKTNWDELTFYQIPEVLVPEANMLSFSNTSVTNDYGWINCLDLLCRLIVFSFKDLKQNTNNHNSKEYHKIVKDMLFMVDEDHLGSGRGMNCAGLLLAGCISLRCLLDHTYDDLQYKTHINDTDRYFIYLQSMEGKKISFGDLFLATCLISWDDGLNKENWLFNKFSVNNLNPVLQACAEQIAISCITSALSTSLWAPFDDNYAIRGLLKRGSQNQINYIMLTLRWLLEKEALRGNYFSEISINFGELQEVYEIIKLNAVLFGFKEVTSGGENIEQYFPVILENSYDRKHLVHNNKLYLRFLTGCLNSATVRWDVCIEEVLAKNIEQIHQDQKFGCWAGVDMFGTENFVYDRSHFSKWLTTMYNVLREINKKCGGNRKLWLRPHVGEGSWVEDLSVRISKFDCNPLSLAKKLKSLSDFFKNNYLNKINIVMLNEVLEFIYRSIFTGWLPIDDVRCFYSKSAFSSLELQRLSSTLQPRDVNKGTVGEKIGTANLETMIDWINHISPHTVEEYDRHCPQIRFGHGSHLGFESTWGAITDLQHRSFISIWIDLNLGSNAITAAKSFNSLINNVELSERLTNVKNIEVAVKEIIDNSRFTCGSIQTEIIERSERIAKFIDLLRKHAVMFVLGSDGQGAESTSIFDEQLHFNKLMHWYYKNDKEAECMNKTLKNNTIEYIKYSIGNINDYN